MSQVFRFVNEFVSVRRPMWALVLALGLVTSCSQESTAPTTPSIVTPPATGPVTPPLPGMLQIVMPADPIDITTSALGLVPYGYHGPDHAVEGHSGWDIELRFGAAVRAAVEGRVLNVGPDPVTPSRFKVKIETVVANHFYTLDYGNLASVSDDIVVDAVVRRGQPLGVPGLVAATVSGTPISYSMVHFQVNDFEYHREIVEPNAVGIELFLTPEARQTFDRVWALSWYAEELTEPFSANPRALPFPLVRTWRLESGGGPMGLKLTRRSLRDTEYEYELQAESGTIIEAGRAVITFGRPLASIDLISPTGFRLGLYDVVDDRLRLALGSPGAPRPLSLSDASVYRTPRPPPSN